MTFYPVSMTYLYIMILTEAALHRCSNKKVFWKYAENLQENTHAEVIFKYMGGRSPVEKSYGFLCQRINQDPREHLRWRNLQH